MNELGRVNDFESEIYTRDGSVRWISDFIDRGLRNGSYPRDLGIWDKLNLSADGETIQPDRF